MLRQKRGKRMCIRKTKITDLPPEIITEILKRLPVKTILRWKCVCKSWRHLFESREFVKSYHSKSVVPNLAITVKSDEKDKIIDDDHFNTITKLCFTYPTFITGSVDGFILLMKHENFKFKLHLCNPITREYIDLLHSHSQPFDSNKIIYSFYGFGVSKVTGQYKAIGIFHDPYMKLPEECKVYTIGTGSWRSIAPHAKVRYDVSHKGEFVKGNLHWLANIDDDNVCISYFDLETEIFSAFSLPALENEKPRIGTNVAIDAVEGTLCICEYTSRYVVQVIIWLMKEYGVEKSWTKQFVIGRSIDIWRVNVVDPIRFSEDGVTLITCRKSLLLFHYSNKNKKTTKTTFNFQGMLESSHPYTPSFFSLKYFEMENVLSL